MLTIVGLVCLHWQTASFVNIEYYEGFLKPKTEYSAQQAVDYINGLPENQRETVHFQDGPTWTTIYYCDKLKSLSKEKSK